MKDTTARNSALRAALSAACDRFDATELRPGYYQITYRVGEHEASTTSAWGGDPWKVAAQHVVCLLEEQGNTEHARKILGILEGK